MTEKFIKNYDELIDELRKELRPIFFDSSYINIYIDVEFKRLKIEYKVRKDGMPSIFEFEVKK